MVTTRKIFYEADNAWPTLWTGTEAEFSASNLTRVRLDPSSRYTDMTPPAFHCLLDIPEFDLRNRMEHGIAAVEDPINRAGWHAYFKYDTVYDFGHMTMIEGLLIEADLPDMQPYDYHYSAEIWDRMQYFCAHTEEYFRKQMYFYS